MKNECNIIRDILPLYTEHMVCSDTAELVEEHLRRCAACRKEYERERKPQAIQVTEESAPLRNLKKKMATKRLQTIALTAVFVAVLLISAFAVLDAPVYAPYSEELLTVTPIGDHGIQITFDARVTDFNYRIYPAPDQENLYYCDVEAWSSLWDRWFSSDNGQQSVVVSPSEPYPITVMYIPNDGTEIICVYGDAGDEGRITLPRLSLGVYQILALIALGITTIIWLATGKKPAIRIWVERAGLYPLSYAVSYFIVCGFHRTSYAPQRDFFLIFFLSFLLYCGLLLAHNIWRIKKEMKEINR